MVGSRRLSSVSFLVIGSLFLAGCAGEDTDSDTPNDDPVTVTDPTDFGYLDEGTATDVAHIHDYWGGATELVIMDKTEEYQATWFGNRLERFHEMRPDDGDIVPQGTGRIDVTVTWQEGQLAMYEDIELYMKTANMTRPDHFVGVLEKGKTFTLETTNHDADLPHQVLSNWLYAFTFTRGETQPRIEVDTAITVKMVAYRTLELPVFPAHPDLWKNETVLPLMFDSHHSNGAGYGYGASYCLAGNETGQPSCFYTHVPDENRTVPRYADHVKVVVDQVNEAGSSVTLAYHGADQRTFKEATPTRVEGTVTTYILKTGGADADGPYSRQSLWEFELWTHGLDREDGGIYRGRYTVTATVHRDAE